jgi:hypothetical protein
MGNWYWQSMGRNSGKEVRKRFLNEQKRRIVRIP